VANKYVNFGFRRDKNLSDSTSGRNVLANILDNLAISQNESFVPEDIYVINGLKGTNITTNDFTQLANTHELVYDTDIQSIISARPHVTLNDRIANYKVFTGDPVYGPGGTGLEAIAIPQSNIVNSIDNTTNGDTIFTDDDNVVEPFVFWDDGIFNFSNYIYPTFVDQKGMLQWNGYFTPNFATINNSIEVSTTGFVLIEENREDTVDGWVTKLFLYEKEHQISLDVPSEITTNVIDLGDDFIFAFVGQTINEFPNVIITNINPDNNTIILDQDITLFAGINLLTLNSNIGEDDLRSTFRLLSLSKNEKIRIRITVWWPDDLPSGQFYNNRTIRFDYLGNTGGNSAPFPYFSTTSENADFSNSPEKIELFIDSRLSGTNDYTEDDFFVANKLLITYQPPLLMSEKVIYENKTTASYYGRKHVIAPSDIFSTCKEGDWLLVSDESDQNAKAYKIEEIRSQSSVFLKEEIDLIGPYPQEFSFRVVKNSGLVGIYYQQTNSVFSLIDNFSSENVNFSLDDLRSDHIFCFASVFEGVNTDFYRLNNINYSTGAYEYQNFQSLPDNLSGLYGLVFVYSDKGLEDRSKEAFCQGVLSKELTQIASSGTNILSVTNTTGLELDDYVQLSGFIENGTQIDSLDEINNTVTLKNSTTPIITSDIPNGTTITVSPDSVNREQCSVVLNTAPPFEGTDTGLKTQSSSSGVWANEIKYDNMNLTTSNPTEELLSASNNYTKTIDIICAGANYKLLIQ